LRRGSSGGGRGHDEEIPDEVKELLSQGKSPLIENFVSKRGNKFAAHLVLSAKKDKAEFEFLPR
jgi:DNA topoisomerase-3